MGANVSVEVRRCTKCKDIKSLEDFYISNKISGYRHYRCKVCDNQRRGELQKDNREYYSIKQKEWRNQNSEHYIEYANGYNYRRYNDVRDKALQAVGRGKIECVRCGFSDIRAIQIDHIDGKGWEHRKTCSSRYQYYEEITANFELYQILCANCNQIKKYEDRKNVLSMAKTK